MPGTYRAHAGSSHCRKMIFLPFGGALGSAWSTWMLVGGRVGGAGTVAFADAPGDAADGDGELLSLLPHAVAPSDSATNGSTNQPDDLTIIGLLYWVGERAPGG